MKKLAAVVAVAALLLASGGLVAFRSLAGGSTDGDPLRLVVQPGWNATKIAKELENRGVVGSAFVFRLYLRVRGNEAALRAGEYELRRNMPFTELAGELERGPELKFVKLTVPEGSTLDQASERVAKQTHIGAEAFRAAATSSTVRPTILPEDLESLEGFLYPKTYYVIEKESAEDVVKRMVAQFEKETRDVSWDGATSFGLTPYEILIIASMIEEEAKVEEERAQVSAVIHNRLQKGMKLEIDATIQYAVKKYGGEPLTESDLNIDSRYNTRKFAGLPPGPIASPRVSSIKAAMQPADSDALYYVLTPDCLRHVFTADYNEFLRAKGERQPC